LAQRLYHLAQWWHLLSLDAPTVAAIWSWFFVYAMHLHLSFIQALLLPVGTWLLYVADRILDGLRSGEILRERHHFHARHRTTFLLVSAFLIIPLAWMVATHMRPEALRDDVWVGFFALLYLFVVHRMAARRLPKELAVALIFAFGSIAWASKSGKGANSTRLPAGPAFTFAQS
jgi:hypothetical protein